MINLNLYYTKYSTRRINMLSFIKNLFGSKPAEPTAAPYKVETPATKTPAAKKSAAKTKTTRKPKAPKA